MKLDKIEITNFRCFESLHVELNKDVNIIVGANGAGKTTILDAIAIALFQVVAAANGSIGKRDRQKQLVALQPTDIQIESEDQEAFRSRKDSMVFRAIASNFYSLNGFPSRNRNGDLNALEWIEYVQFRLPAQFIYESGRSEKLSQLQEYFKELWFEIKNSSEEALIPLPVIAYYRANRRLESMPALGDVFKMEVSREKAYVDALNAGTDFKAMCQWFYLRENAELRERVSDKRKFNIEFPDLIAIREAIRTVIRDVERIFFEGTPPRLRVAIHDGMHGPISMDLEQLSDGYRNLLALVFDFARRLAQAHPNWPNPLKAPGILLIDEVELHLHPKWQQTVIPRLREVFPNTQLIVATHSPAILTTVRREHIHILGSDRKFEVLPHDVGTYGAENSRVLAEVFGTHSRPPNIEIVAKLDKYLHLVEKQEHDTDQAKELRKELERSLGTGDPALYRADMRIHQLKVLGK